MPDLYTTEEFETAYTYTGNDPGAAYTGEKTVLRVWAPTAAEVKVNLYANGDPAAQPDPDKPQFAPFFLHSFAERIL